MDKLVIRGGEPLHGTVRAAGSKNGTLPILFACLLAEDPVTLTNVPRLIDIRTTMRILIELGVSIDDHGDRLTIRAPDDGPFTAPYELVRRMRASVCSRALGARSTRATR